MKLNFINIGTDTTGRVVSVMTTDSVQLGHIRRHDEQTYTFMPGYKHKAHRLLDADMLREIAVRLEMMNTFKRTSND